jgi:hypothetical protein
MNEYEVLVERKVVRSFNIWADTKDEARKLFKGSDWPEHDFGEPVEEVIEDRLLGIVPTGRRTEKGE